MNGPPSRAHRLLDRGPRAHWWRREKTATGRFHYVDEARRPIRDHSALERIRHLAIPPAWTEVRIAPAPRARIQALGLDGGGKLQYIYHPQFVARRQRHKFERIEHFAQHLPRLRQLTTENLEQPGLSKSRVLATVTRIINRLYFRVGSEAGVRRYHTYGITTLRRQHLRFDGGGHVSFSFEGKHHIRTRRILVDESLTQVLRELQDVPGPRLFKYLNGDGSFHNLRGADVNHYLKSLTSAEFSAKDFRTWAGTLLVAQELTRIGPAENQREAKRRIAQAIRRAADQLGNTPAVCRRAYLHPSVLQLYLRGFTLERPTSAGLPIAAHQEGYQPDEMALLELFHVARVLAADRRAARLAVPIPMPSPSTPDPPAPIEVSA